MPLGAQESRPRPTAKAYLNSLRHVIAQRVSLIKYAPFFLSLHATSARWGRGMLVNSIHGVDTLRYVVVHSGLSCTCFTEVLSSYAILYRLSTPNHNLIANVTNLAHIVLYRLSTSNHNQRYEIISLKQIVLYRLSTSNHNPSACSVLISALSYIVFLHQTTTRRNGGESLAPLSYIVFLHQTTTPAQTR